MANPPMLVLVHSPLVGPLTWEPTAERLRDMGYQVVVPSLAEAGDGGPPYYRRFAENVAAAVAGASPRGRVVLAGHSGAGALLPAIAEAVPAGAQAAIFVDATLPHPGATWLDSAPPQLRDELLALARRQHLPPWNEWFPADVLAELLPDQGLRERFAAALPEIPLAYCRERAPDVRGWPPARCAYIQLSAGYQQAADEAERSGWLIYRHDADHLAMLTRPATVVGLLSRAVFDLSHSSAGGRSEWRDNQ